MDKPEEKVKTMKIEDYGRADFSLDKDVKDRQENVEYEEYYNQDLEDDTKSEHMQLAMNQ